MAEITALVCGHATLDRAGEALLPGGSVYYAAHALAALGARVRVLTAAGRDLPADVFRVREQGVARATATSTAGRVPLSPALSPAPRGRGRVATETTRRGEATLIRPGSIDPLVLPAPATTTFVNRYAPDGSRSQQVLAAAPPLDPARLPAAWGSADLLVLAPVLGELHPAAFAAAVRARVVGLCVQGLVRAVRPDGAVEPRRLEPDPELLAGVTAAVLGEDEAAGQPDLADRLAAAVPIVVFTRGVRGCEVIHRGRVRHVGIHPAREIDPTGAGDVFAAAFFLRLAEGDDPVDAARLGAAAASIAVEGRGGEALPRIAEAWDRAGRVPIR